MREVWLQINRRALLLGCVPPLVLVITGIWLVVLQSRQETISWWLVGWVAVGIGLATIGLLLVQLRHPRIAYEAGNVLFYLRSGPPIAVPVDVVEAFFVGQGPAELPGLSRQPRTANLVARLSQRHTEWTRHPVKLALGSWQDGYVTVRGTWCEPLDIEVVRRLNRRLKDAQARHGHA